MPTVTFIDFAGSRHTVSADSGESLMQAAVNNMVPGIIGDCGGCCSCATCHVYVDAEWQGRVPPAADDEKAMLECVLHPQASSRLGCQIKFGSELDGLVVRLPESQT